MKIVIIGGTGVFGKLWEEYFSKRGHEVIISSRSTKLKPKDAIIIGDVIIFCVSIRNTIDVIKNLIPLIPEGKLIMDFTGIKLRASQELSKYKLGEVVSVHPMFGPWIKSLKNQNIAYDPISPGEKWNEIYKMWNTDGANLIELSAKKHDEIVSIVQSSVHFVNILLGHILYKRGLDINEVINIATPNSRMQMLILSRFLNQSASLYTDMQFYNDYYKDNILPEIKDYVNFLEEVIENNNTERFEEEFNNTKEYIGQEFLDRSLELTEIIDNELKEVLKSKK